MSKNNNDVNPFQSHNYGHYFYAFEEISKYPHAKILDYGCGKGDFLGTLYENNIKSNLYGYDVDPQSITKAKQKYKKINFILGKIDDKLPYKDSSFNVVTMFHVLEHVSSEDQAIKEIYRVLKKDGVLILSSPYSGMFEWADTANLRYRCPKLHKWFFKIFLGSREYEKRFILKKSSGLYGDCSDNRQWHKHYKETEIEQLLRNDFNIKRFTKFSLILPFLYVLNNVWDFFFKSDNWLISKLIHFDNRLMARNLSYNMIITAIKKEKDV